MAKFEPIQFAPFGIQRDSAAANSKLTLEDRKDIYQMFRGEFTEPQSPLGKVVVGINNADTYVVDLNLRTSTSMVALWLSGAQLELASISVLLSGIVQDNDEKSLEEMASRLSTASLPDPAVSELITRVRSVVDRPLIATMHLYERSYDSVTINQWSMGLASAFFDTVKTP